LHELFANFHSPYEINIVGGLIGVAIVIIATVINIFSRNNTVLNIFIGIGGSLVAGAALNILSEWRTGNLLIQTVMDGIYQTAAKSRIVRYHQSITFVIEDFEFEGVPYLKFSCTHEYTLKNSLFTSRSICIDTFNDISIPNDLNNRLGVNKTQFDKVTIKKGEEPPTVHNRRNNKYSNEFFFDEYGRPHFLTEGLKLSKNDKNVTITFEINNIHKTNDKHTWFFEEISNDLILRIDNKSSFKKDRFKLIINHPNKENIESHNADKMNNAGQLLDNYCEIEMNYVFLPYQGFEIYWDELSVNN
jgi:hypothetical protein